MTTTDALFVLRASTSTSADLYDGRVVREADETGSDEDRDEVDAAAHLLGWDVVEDEDGAWALAER